MTEVGVVIAKDGTVLHWHLPPDRTEVSLPDSRSLWDILWEHRSQIAGFAHSHPGRGIPGPSHTDITTFAAIESALGARLQWWITSEDQLLELRWVGPHPHTYVGHEVQPHVLECSWIQQLRFLSYK